MQINEILSQLHGILKCKMALLLDGSLYFYPEAVNVPFAEQELPDYNAWSIEESVDKKIFYTHNKAEISEKAIALAVLFIRNQMNCSNSLYDSATKLLSGKYNYADIAVISQLVRKDRALHLIAIFCADIHSIQNELLEIIKNSVSVKYIFEYQGNMLALAEEQDIFDACSGLQKNILTELFIETVIAIGGRLEQPQQLAELYNNCMEAMLLKQSYGLNQSLLDYQSMLLYKLIASMDKELKEDIVHRIFSTRFIELLSSELELTIEEMFKNNLNLTDTSARLFVHRNTLLYRIDKIYKLTGFDLRKFEDSMIFKLSWLMYKEKHI